VSSTSCWSRTPASSRSRVPPCGPRSGPRVSTRRGDRGAVRRAALAAISRSWHNRLHCRFRLDASASKGAAHAPGSGDRQQPERPLRRLSLRPGRRRRLWAISRSCRDSSDASVSAVLARTLARPETAVPGSGASGPRTERAQHPRGSTRRTPENCFTLSCSEVSLLWGPWCRSRLSLRRSC
jgi:hypothetical protein